MSNIGRVKCRVCINEKDGFCSVRKCRTKGNKSRVCVYFANDFSKVRIKEKVPTVMRPDWYWKRKEVKRAYKEFLKKQEEEKQFKDTVSNDKSLNGTSCPDCLSGFRSTASSVGTTSPQVTDIDILNMINTTVSGAEEKDETQ